MTGGSELLLVNRVSKPNGHTDLRRRFVRLLAVCRAVRLSRELLEFLIWILLVVASRGRVVSALEGPMTSKISWPVRSRIPMLVLVSQPLVAFRIDMANARSSNLDRPLWPTRALPLALTPSQRGR